MEVKGRRLLQPAPMTNACCPWGATVPMIHTDGVPYLHTGGQPATRKSFNLNCPDFSHHSRHCLSPPSSARRRGLIMNQKRLIAAFVSPRGQLDKSCLYRILGQERRESVKTGWAVEENWQRSRFYLISELGAQNMQDSICKGKRR